MLGKLEKVELREVWKKEAKNFTPWLAEEENLELLGKAIGIELEFVNIEVDVGRFKADILCKDTGDYSLVLIENQLEKTDHNHLGQLITYAIGLQATTIVWVASKFIEEHRAALDRLNQITDDNFRFFGLAIELWKIGNSPAAPKFNVIIKPNNWSKPILQSAKSSDGIESKTKAMQYFYWQGLNDYLENKGSKLRTQDPRKRHWHTFSVGKSGFRIDATLNTTKNKISVELCITDKINAKTFYNLLEQEKEAIENEVEENLEWKEKR